MEHRAHTGSHVTILREDGRHFRFHLVSPMEADLDQGRLSVAAPLGRALLGRRPGEEFSYQAPRGRIRAKVLEIERVAE